MGEHRDLINARSDVLASVDALLDVPCDSIAFWDNLRGLAEARDRFREVCADLDGPGPTGRRRTSKIGQMPEKGSLRMEVLTAIVARHRFSNGADGLTCDELERQLTRPHATISPIVNELEHRRLIADSHRTRITRAGARRAERGLPPTKAIVWVPTDIALAAYTEERS